MFIRWAFAEVCWRPQELGACLIIDDPLLKPRYGCCDFPSLANLMKHHGFTANIAFIPWNWRRTSRKDSAFFRREADHFSISIHGCDHTGSEFGNSETAELVERAELAQSRMRLHQARSAIRHEPVMVFPQGVFSAQCPAVLKRSHFVAAVNTDVNPVSAGGETETRLRDVWDVAITRYGSFAVFSRRYPHHGLENFAFDLLLGKPCLVVTHHDFFRDAGKALIEFIERLSSLNCTLHWRSLGEVVKRACRHRMVAEGLYEYRMYAQELWVMNSSSVPAAYTIRKTEDNPEFISRVKSGGNELDWRFDDGHVEFSDRIPAGEERVYQVECREQPRFSRPSRDFRARLAAAVRRLLSEARDEFVYQRHRFTSVDAHSKISIKG